MTPSQRRPVQPPPSPPGGGGGGGVVPPPQDGTDTVPETVVAGQPGIDGVKVTWTVLVPGAA